MIVAEVSANHNGSLALAKELVHAAAEAGADAVKFQTYLPTDLTIDHDGEGFVVQSGSWAGRKLIDLYHDGTLPYEWHKELFALARQLDVLPFSTPFSKDAITFLEGLKPAYYKIASFEITDIWLIRAAANTTRPLIISTGTATDAQIRDALVAAEGARSVTLLHCISSYPAKAEQYNLQRIPELMFHFNCQVGLSDHSLSLTLPAAATALGASVIEKHLKMPGQGGLDSEFSLEPHQFKAMVENVREVQSAMIWSEKKADFAHINRSLYAVEDIALGSVIDAMNVRSIRPGLGLPPKYLPNLIGKKAKAFIARGTPMSFDLVI